MAGFGRPACRVQSRGGRCVFSSFRPAKTVFRLSWLKQAGARFLALLFPADCAVCGVELPTAGPIPVCDACLEPPEPFSPEYCCVRCRAVFLNPAPLDQQGLCALCRLGATEFSRSEANVARYNEAIRSMTDRSQFILITHVRKTMQSVDVLYGVTMGEPGVSRIVSVKVNDHAVARSETRAPNSLQDSSLPDAAAVAESDEQVAVA